MLPFAALVHARFLNSPHSHHPRAFCLIKNKTSSLCGLISGAPSCRSRRLPSTTRPPGTAYSRRFVFTVARKRFPPPAEPGMQKRGIAAPRPNVPPFPLTTYCFSLLFSCNLRSKPPATFGFINACTVRAILRLDKSFNCPFFVLRNSLYCEDFSWPERRFGKAIFISGTQTLP